MTLTQAELQHLLEDTVELTTRDAGKVVTFGRCDHCKQEFKVHTFGGERYRCATCGRTSEWLLVKR